MSYTNSAFEASDIFGWKQALFLKSYVDLVTPLLVVLLIICFFRGLTFKKRQLLFLPITLLVTTSCVQERRPTELSLSPISYLFKVAKINYVDWDFATNIKENGILNHLFLTLPMGQIPPKGDVPYHSQKVPKKALNDDQPDVFLILCESCYTSLKSSFVTPMAKLSDSGFVQSTMISPVYGGMTAEAEFEVLTGLPSSRYKGIDFQYFADSYSSMAMALPKAFDQNGYSTLSAHNNGGTFWRRNVIHPKFGFKNSYFLEDMKWTDKDKVPEDSILFDKALEVYKRNLEQKKRTFAFLITLYTHGPYKENNGDGGEYDYKRKLEKSILQFSDFQNKVSEAAQKRRRPVVFLIFGDHKPSMTISFYKKHIFSEDFFATHGETNDSFQFTSLNDSQRLIYGRVPLFVKAFGVKTKSLARDISVEIKDRPLYCLPGVIADHTGIDNPFYSYLKKVCQGKPEELVDKEYIKRVFNEAMYRDLLFD